MTEESTPYVLKMRNTTASAPPKPRHEWIVILPDHEDVLDKRMAVRPYDKSNLTLLIVDGVGSLRKTGSTKHHLPPRMAKDLHHRTTALT